MSVSRQFRRFGDVGLRAALRMQTNRSYWKSVRTLRRLRSRSGLAATTARIRAQRARSGARTLGRLIRRALPTGVLSAATVIAVIWLDGRPWMPPVPAQPSAVGLYGALAGFAGVFLGFYYTALGIVVEQVYAKGSRTLRRLVLSGRAEEMYVWVVVYLGVTSLLFLAIEATGAATGAASVGLVTLAGIAALVGARGLMMGGLRYFDQSVLAEEARREVERLYNLVRDEPAGEVVTTAARINAEPHVDVLVELAESGDANVAHHALLLLQRYWTTKPERTSASTWWRPAVVRPDWFLADSTRVRMAVRRTGQIREETRPDWMWVERPLVECVAEVLNRRIAAGDWGGAGHIVARVAETVRLGALSLLVEEAATLVDAVTDVMLARWMEGSVEPGREGGVRPADLWDVQGMCVVQLVIGTRLGWESFVERLPVMLDGVSAETPADAEKLRFPVRRKERLRILAQKLEFEATVEGATPTPRWFWADFVAPSLLWELRDQFERVEDVIDRQQGDVRPVLVGDPLASGSAARRTTEVRHLWGLFRDVVQAADTSLREMVRSEDYDLPDVPLDRANRFDVRERVEDTLWVSESVWPLLRRRGDPMAEELVGHGYARLMDRSVGALVAQDLPTFEVLFRRVFGLAFILDGRVPFQGREWLELTQFKLSVQPVLDLMALSGLALIRDEVSGPGYWEPVRAEWDQVLDQVSNARALIKRYLYLAENAIVAFGVGARVIERSQWTIDLSQALQAEGVTMNFGDYGGPPPPPRRILRQTLSGVMGIDDPIHTFAVFYLAARPEAAGLELGNRLGSTVRFLERNR